MNPFVLILGGAVVWWLFGSKEASAKTLVPAGGGVVVPPAEGEPEIVPSVSPVPGATAEDEDTPGDLAPQANGAAVIPGAVSPGQPPFPAPAQPMTPAIPGLPGVVPGGAVPQITPTLPPQPSAPVPPIIPTTPDPPTPASAAEEPTPGEDIAADTLDVMSTMLAREGHPGWKVHEPKLEPWQKARGLFVDGLFGTKSGLRMGQEVGTIPLVRYWPKGSYPSGTWLRDYQASLRHLASQAPEPRRAQLIKAAEREQGQGFGKAPEAAAEVIQLINHAEAGDDDVMRGTV